MAVVPIVGYGPRGFRQEGDKAMSHDNVELVRPICAACDRGDYRAVDWADPEIEFVVSDGPSRALGPGSRVRPRVGASG
jgi:hypothetical protein